MPVSIPPFLNVPAPNDDVKSAWAQQLTQYAVDHVNDPVDAHDATAISFAPVGTIIATTVQEAIMELASDIGAGVIPDGDKGDITVSSGVWSIDDGAVTNADIADGAVTSLKIAPDAVNALHIADGSITNAKLAPIENEALSPVDENTIKGRITAATGEPEDLTPVQAREVLASDSLDVDEVLRGDGTWGAPPFQASAAGGSDGQVQFNDGGAMEGAAYVEIDGGDLLLAGHDEADQYLYPGPDPVKPKITGIQIGNKVLPFLLHGGGGGPSGLSVRPSILAPSSWSHSACIPHAGTASIAVVGLTAVNAVGVLTAITPAPGPVQSGLRRVEYRVNTPAGTNVAGLYTNTPVLVMPDATSGGGFIASMRWGLGLNGNISTSRGFCGFRLGTTGAPIDEEPSTQTNMFGMAWDTEDSHIKFMHNDASGAATEVNLVSVNFTVGTANAFELIVYIPWGEVEVNWMIISHHTGAMEHGVATTNLPAAFSTMAPRAWIGVGGISSTIGVAIMGWDFWSV